MSDVASPIKWHGGKYYLAPKLVTLIPPHRHRVYAYAGGLSDLFAWPCEGVSEVVNDVNLDLMTFWRVLQDEKAFSEFVRIIEATPFSEVTFRESAIISGTDVQRAAKFFVRCRQSRQGLLRDFATLSRNRIRREMNEQVSAWLTAVDGLHDVHERLKRVVVLNRPALEVIRQQDGPETFFYLDPPYLHETRVTKSDYQFEMTKEDHEQLLMKLGSIDGKFLLSGYPSELYQDAAELYGWRSLDFELPNNASSKAKKDRKIERVWMNYVPGGGK